MLRTTFSLALLTALTWQASPARANESMGSPQAAINMACDAAYRCTAAEQGAAPLARHQEHAQAIHGLIFVPRRRVSAAVATCENCQDGPAYGRLLEALLQWTDQLVRRIDRLGVIQTPWSGDEPTGASSEAASTQGPRVTARLRAVRMEGGYGVEARVYF